MKTLLLVCIMFLFWNNCFTQSALYKKVTIDIDAKITDSILPIEAPFIVNLISDNKFTPTEYQIVRIRERNAYVGRGIVLYYQNVPLKFSNVKRDTISKVRPTKVTVTNKITSATNSETTIVSEFSAAPNSGLAKHIATGFVDELDPNFHYYLVKLPTDDLREKLEKNQKVYPIIINNMDTMSMINFLETDGAIYIGHTALDPSENITRHITASFGISYLAMPVNKTVVPYLGLRYNFLPVNKWVRRGMAKMSATKNNKWSNRFALDIGLTINSIEDTAYKVKDLMGKLNVLTGVGLRIASYVYLSAGVVWYKRVDPVILSKATIRNRFYTSLSLDWDIGKTFSSFSKLLGVSF